MIMLFSCVNEKLGFVNCAFTPDAANRSRVFEGDEPPPNGCGSSMTRTSRPRFAASSNARITLRSDKIYISSQMDFCAFAMAFVITCSPSSGSTKTCTPWAPDPTLQLLWHCGVLLNPGIGLPV